MHLLTPPRLPGDLLAAHREIVDARLEAFGWRMATLAVLLCWLVSVWPG